MEETGRFVLVDQSSYGATFCLGVFKDFHTAVGHMMEQIWDFKTSYEDEGDEFEYTPLTKLDGDGGYFIRVNYKAKSWEKPSYDYYFILEGNEREEKEDENQKDWKKVYDYLNSYPTIDRGYPNDPITSAFKICKKHCGTDS